VTSPRELGLDAIQTALRLVPWPTDTGVRAVGAPGPESPVLITGNYDLTVRWLLRALDGVDAWVVVAPSAGINVWCAAAGGHLTTHQVVTALRTSGIEERVRHRRAILPQLAATGVSVRDVSRRCGWKLRFGPVRAEDVPRYLAQGAKKSDEMRRVRFGARERVEMASVWAAPTSVLLAAGALWLRPAWTLPLVGLAWLMSIALFCSYDRIPGPRRLLFSAAWLAIALAAVALAGGGSSALAAGALASLALAALLTFDHAGSTPVEGGSHFDSKRWRIRLDRERCAGVYSCVEVCPEACFERQPELRKVELAHDERCVKCGACVVQCPQDALHFVDDAGAVIAPAEVRRYKLTLLGQRVAKREPDVAEGR
jgi:NAD-dependent dihydropyrimidine dehydrogenase PreA subunit